MASSLHPCFLTTFVVSFPGKLPWPPHRPGHCCLHHVESHFCAWNCTESTAPSPRPHVRLLSFCAYPFSVVGTATTPVSHWSQGRSVSASCVRTFRVLISIRGSGVFSLLSLCNLSPFCSPTWGGGVGSASSLCQAEEDSLEIPICLGGFLCLSTHYLHAGL